MEGHEWELIQQQERTQGRKIRWHEWQRLPQVLEQNVFHAGERVFEFSDEWSITGWKPHPKDAQEQLKLILEKNIITGGATNLEPVNCLDWEYLVKLDIYRSVREDFVDAPMDAIGYQCANHSASPKNTKRWIRLSTYPGQFWSRV